MYLSERVDLWVGGRAGNYPSFPPSFEKIGAGMTHLSALDHFGRETKCATGKKKWTINPSPFLNTHPGAPHFQRRRLTATPIGQTAAIAIEIHKLPVQQPWIGNDGVRLRTFPPSMLGRVTRRQNFRKCA